MTAPTVTLSDLTLESRDGDWGSDGETPESQRFAIIRGTDFGAVTLRQVDSVPRRYLPNRTSPRRTLITNDILIETAGGSPKSPTGRTLLVTAAILECFEGPVSCASFARFIRVDPRRVHAPYLQRMLQGLYHAGLLETYQVQHTGVARFQYTTFASTYRFELPPLPEQQAIAEVLGALDDKIAANTKLAAVADEYLSTLMDDLLREGSTLVELAAVADVNAISVKPESDGVLRYVDIAAVSVGRFDHPELTAWAGAPGRARRKLRRGDTMWSTVRPNRRSHALNLSDDPLLVASTGLAVLSPRTIGFAYLYEATRRPEFTAYLENVAEGSAYPAVRADRFAVAPFPLLKPDRIDSFESIAAPVRESIHSLGEENRTLAATRDALLPQLMSGKLRVRDAEATASAVGA